MTVERGLLKSASDASKFVRVLDRMSMKTQSKLGLDTHTVYECQNQVSSSTQCKSSFLSKEGDADKLESGIAASAAQWVQQCI
eukprot:1161076-Pelagomonas_calceolata.AAC.7